MVEVEIKGYRLGMARRKVLALLGDAGGLSPEEAGRRLDEVWQGRRARVTLPDLASARRFAGRAFALGLECDVLGGR